MEHSMNTSIEHENKEAIIQDLMENYGTAILHLVYSYVKDAALAEDLTQEIFVKSYHHLHTYNGKSKMTTWLWRIAINHCKDHLKSWYNRKVTVSEQEQLEQTKDASTTEDAVIQNHIDHELAGAVMDLPDKYREVIYLHYYEDLSTREMADVLKKNENTLKTRLKRARVLLKQRLGGTL
ncbi:sigma-70 family RNA polymerase sigma factor [Halobacillus kuroshimensis]